MRLYTFVMAAMSGFAVSAAIQYGVTWLHQRLPPLFAAFAISVGVQSAVLAVFASAETIESLDRSLNWRTTIALLTHLFLLWLIAALGRREGSWFVRGTSAVLFAGFVANGAGLNIVGHVVAMDQMELPWGETVSLAIRGPGHPALAAVLYLAVLSVHVYSCVVARGLLRREPSTGWLMLFGGLGGTVSVLWSSLIDLNLVRAPYPTVLALVFWLVLFAVMLSRQFVQAEQRLIGANERLHSFIEKSPSVAIQWYDRQGRVVLWNTASEELFGYSEAEAMGRTLDELFQGQTEFVEFVASLARIAESGESIGPMHYPFTHRNGDARVCLATIFRIPGDKGEPLFACVDVDVTERTRLENKMRDSQRMQAIGQLAGGVAHDFNNLLTVIAGYCELLQVQLADDDERRRSVGAIHDATIRAAWLTQRLLAFSRQAIVEPKVIDINVMVDEIHGILRRLIGESVEIRIEHGGEPLPVSIDPGQWSQLMINLAINARDAMPDGAHW